ncbi:MAG: leucine-rich repeat domain-containing protein [Lachnospiraceae bacterium]|nr:leucine-rich repeat domain-containing protein [Lachnospiraceae bacterium]
MRNRITGRACGLKAVVLTGLLSFALAGNVFADSIPETFATADSFAAEDTMDPALVDAEGDGETPPVIWGYCGDRSTGGKETAKYTLYDTDNDRVYETVRITGTGKTGYADEMQKVLADGSSKPLRELARYWWSENNYSYHIKDLYIDGVTIVGNFQSGGTGDVMRNAENIHIGPSVTTLTDSCFAKGKFQNITFSGNLKEISKGAFSECLSFEEIRIPDSVTTVGENAFSGCSNAKKVVFGKNVKTLGAGCFSNLPIESIDIPAGIAGIPDRMVAGCTALKQVTLHPGVTSMGKEVFSSCESLKQVVLPGTIKELGNVFYGATGIEEINIPAGVETITDGIAGDCTNLKKITLGEGPKGLSHVAVNCPRLTEITIPASLEKFNYSSIVKNCPKIKTVGPKKGYNLNYNWTDSIPAYAFGNCENIESFTLAGVRTTDSSICTRNKNIKEVMVAGDVSEIGKEAFLGCSNLERLTFASGSTLTAIQGSAFEDCENLKAVVLPDSITFLGSSVFDGCCNLASVNIPSHLTECEGYLFYNCPDLKTAGPAGDGNSYNITIPDLGIMPKNLFWHANYLQSIVFPKNTYELGYACCSHCDRLCSVAMPNTVITIGASAFSVCPNLKNIKIPPYVERIGDAAFSGCKKIKSLTFPDTLFEMGSNVVTYEQDIEIRGYDNSPSDMHERKYGKYISQGKMVKIYLSDSVCMKNLGCRYAHQNSAVGELPRPDHTIEGYEFLYWMDSKGKKYLPDTKVGEEDYIYLYAHWIRNGVKDREPGDPYPPNVGRTELIDDLNYKITAVNQDGTCTAICYNCANFNLKKAVVCDSFEIDGFTCKVTAIDKGAFQNRVNLKSVVIGANVEKIGKDAFSGCTKLSKIKILSTRMKKPGKNAFKNVAKKATATVPRDMYGTYKKYLKARGFKGKKRRFRKL